MASRDEVTLPATRPKSRKSLSHIPPSFHGTLDQENITTDVGGLIAKEKRTMLEVRPNKKSRSKSIGPGGLDALKDSTGNRRKSIAAPLPKSILKPTIAPLPEIPPHVSARRVNPQKPSASTLSDDGISSAIITGTDNLPNPFSIPGDMTTAETRVMLRTEEEQQAAARGREQKEQNAEKDLEARRALRRKSLANRRVSFAPEATLHTWDVVEYMQDSTTSSASTNSTRRASSASAGIADSPSTPLPPVHSSDPAEAPSTPPEQVEDDTVTVSPAHQRDLHQKKRRRSSGIPPLNFNNPDDEDLSSSPSDGSSVAGAEDIRQAFGDEPVFDSNSDSSEDEGTAMSLDMGDATDISVASVKSSASSTDSSARLESALQLAAEQAGTQGIDFDEHGGLEACEEDEIVASFSPWSKKPGPSNLASHDQENMNPFSPAFMASLSNHTTSDEELTMEMTRAVGGIIRSEQSDEEMTMDMTVAVGGILPSKPQRSVRSHRKSAQPPRRQSARRRSSGEVSSMGDETMDMTRALGGIQTHQDVSTGSVEDEDMTMELTTVMGSILAQGYGSLTYGRRESTGSAGSDGEMDMTMAVGGILPPGLSRSLDIENQVSATNETGAINMQQPSSFKRPEARRIMEEEADHAEPSSSPFQAEVQTRPQQLSSAATTASETGSPSIAPFRGKGLRRSGGFRVSTTPRSNKESVVPKSPLRKPTTPSKQLTPKPSRPTTPTKTPPSKNVVMRTASPKKLFAGDLKLSTTAKLTPSNNASPKNKLFQRDRDTGAATPSVVLNHHRRRSSGIGIDKAGLGSPRVAALLDRRGSIGEKAVPFASGQFGDRSRGLRFGEEVIEQELHHARREDWDPEDGRKIMGHEAEVSGEDKDATVNLKEMIESLTPKKRPLKGRKSLHVGAAKGILGKRPAELDEEDDDEDQDGVKRLKNLQGSPVKNIKLQAPPTKAETTGRATRSAPAVGGNLIAPTAALSPDKQIIVSTPRGQGRFKDPEQQPSAHNVKPFEEKEVREDNVIDDPSVKNDQMKLQDFLNMTSIRFMELTTTKRRHTVAPGTLSNSDRSGCNQDDMSLESCVVAGACTIPMLELFQHSCRELKKYISEGRSVVREIETDTYEDNPPLFREYMFATPDFRAIMDSQFKNVKTHARLLSKAMWYEWRMKLLEGIKEELCKINDGMIADSDILQYQEQLLGGTLPFLLQQHDQASQEEADLQAVADELATCDQNELQGSRQRLTSVEDDIKAKQLLIRELRARLQQKDTAIQAASERKQFCLEDIRESEKIREECRGWTGNEVASLKGKVDNLERKHGWKVTGISGTVTSLSFRGELELVLDAASFRSNDRATPCRGFKNSRLDLWYIAGNRECNPLPCTTEKSFFLDSIRDGIRSLPQSQTTIKELLQAVSTGWRKALNVIDDIQSITLNSPTEIAKTSDSSLIVRVMLLLVPLASKIELQFHVDAEYVSGGLGIRVRPTANVIYGERFNEKKMVEFLSGRIGDHVTTQHRSRLWTEAIADLETKLLARGTK